MPLGSLLISAYNDLRAYTMIRTSESSQVLALLPQSSLPQCLRLLQQIKLLLLLWKFQPILAKLLAKGKKLKLLRARTRTTTREKARLQTPPSLSPSKLLNQKLPRQKLRTLVLLVHLFSLFTVFVCFFFFFKDMYFTLIINEVMANSSVVISFHFIFFYLNCTYDLED